MRFLKKYNRFKSINENVKDIPEWFQVLNQSSVKPGDIKKPDSQTYDELRESRWIEVEKLQRLTNEKFESIESLQEFLWNKLTESEMIDDANREWSKYSKTKPNLIKNLYETLRNDDSSEAWMKFNCDISDFVRKQEDSKKETVSKWFGKNENTLEKFTKFFQVNLDGKHSDPRMREWLAEYSNFRRVIPKNKVLWEYYGSLPEKDELDKETFVDGLFGQLTKWAVTAIVDRMEGDNVIVNEEPNPEVGPEVTA